MSRRIVRYEGEGRARRPVYADEGPASASASSPIAMHERMKVPGRELGAPTGGAGAIERRQLYDALDDIRAEEARAARASQGVGSPGRSPALITDTERAKASRHNGGAVNRARLVARTGLVAIPAPAPEEPAMSIDAAPIEPLDPAPAFVADAPGLVEAGEAVIAAAVELESAEQDLAALAVDGGTDGISRLTRRQREILDAVIAARGDRRQAAGALATKIATVEATLEHIGKKGSLPIDLIPLLPARFAKFARVPA